MAARLSQRPGVLDDATFDRLVRAHRLPLERYARGLGASREDAEELAATALLRAYQSPPGAQLEREWRAWLRTVTQNLWIDSRRRRQLRLVSGDEVLGALSPPSRSAEQTAAIAEEAREICAAIARLPRAQRVAIYLREVRGLSYEEIAAELGVTPVAVTSTLKRARDTVNARRRTLPQALAGISFASVGLIRRAAGASRLAAGSGAASKLALPVLLFATACGASLVVHNVAFAAPAHVDSVRPAPNGMQPPDHRLRKMQRLEADGSRGVVNPRRPPNGTPRSERAPVALPAQPPATTHLATADVSDTTSAAAATDETTGADAGPGRASASASGGGGAPVGPGTGKPVAPPSHARSVRANRGGVQRATPRLPPTASAHASGRRSNAAAQAANHATAKTTAAVAKTRSSAHGSASAAQGHPAAAAAAARTASNDAGHVASDAGSGAGIGRAQGAIGGQPAPGHDQANPGQAVVSAAQGTPSGQGTPPGQGTPAAQPATPVQGMPAAPSTTGTPEHPGAGNAPAGHGAGA